MAEKCGGELLDRAQAEASDSSDWEEDDGKGDDAEDTDED